MKPTYKLAATLVAMNILPVMAQDSEALVVFGDAEVSKNNQLGAFKTNTPLVDVPQSVSVTSQAEIQDQAMTSVGDVVDYTPGVNNTQGEGHRDAVILRGVNATATSSFFANGFRDDVQYYRPLYNVEKVEVIKGANALTFGRGGVGGVINRELKKAELDETFNEYLGRIDSFGATYGQFDYNKVIDDKTAVRLNMFQENLSNHRDFFDGDRVGFNPTLTYEISEDTTLNFSYEYNNHERFIDRGIPTGADGKPVESLSDIVFGDSELNTSTLEAHTFNLTLEHNISDSWKARVNAFYGDYDKVYQNFYASDYNAITNEVTIDGYLDTTDRQNFILSGDLVGEFTTGQIDHKLLVGAEYTYTSSDQNRYNANFTPDENSDSDTEIFNASSFSLANGVGVNANGTTVYNDFNSQLNDDTETTIHTYSFFIQDEIALLDQLDLVLGARFDSFDVKIKDNEAGGTSASQVDSFVTPRVGLVYKPIEELSIYASYSEAYLPSSGGQFANLGDQMDPDKYTNLEAGVKYNLSDNLLVSLAAFQNNQTLYSPDNNQNQVEDEAEVNGIEFQIKGALTDKWFVSAGYTYTDAETSSGDRALRIPEHTASIWNRYQVTDKLGLGLGIVYDHGSLTGNGTSSYIPSYTRVDAAAFYEFNDDFRMQLNIENLFDTDYYPTSHSTHQATVGAPINAGITFVGKF